jgi:hypothetical protein
MRFTIRDFLWLTVVVALGVSWWIDHRLLDKRIDELRLSPSLEVRFDRDSFKSTTPLGGTRTLPPAGSS